MVGVQTLVFFHAHPDDEASQTSGTMSIAAALGHRVVTVFATNGEHGTVPADLASGESVADRRRAEAEAAARVIGTQRIAWLGYEDSGMTGWEQNNNQRSFVQATLDQAAGRLAAILDEEDADALIGYDWHGNYGHPDHIKVHQVTYRAVELAHRRPRVLEQTSNRDRATRLAPKARELGLDMDLDEWVGDDGLPIGLPETDLRWQVDVTGVIDRKRAALVAYASQSDTQWMLSLPEAALTLWLGTEHYREADRPGPMERTWPFVDS